MIFGLSAFEWGCNILFYLEFCVFLHHVLTPRLKTRWMAPIYVLLSLYLLFASLFLQKMSVARILLLPVSLMIFNCVFYKDKRLRCIFCAWLVMALMFLTELIVLAIAYPPEMLAGRIGDAAFSDQIKYWTLEMVMGAVLYWLASIFMNRVRDKLSIREMMMFIFFPASQTLLIYGWVNATRLNGGERHQLLVIIVMVLCLAADAGLFASMLRVSRQIEMEQENQLLAARIAAQHAHYEALTAQYETVRRMRHDIDKHIQLIDALLSSGDEEQAARYTAELAAEFGRGPALVEEEDCAE